ncbi:hypothetical protein PHYSODRAFT_329361 [Phytophthora sojae]|uniref:Uncharacterized protein n=1 Tax=Phytophthora sojae (strain P6497) TaxID=1094619 RepID=G4Z275_PHYSP|nr:hypothetical protein PHYSODRAFT_329361 [Phytophthora sojae]EGZ21410.1 hypothetical protein PHYSODRAFT_329361 [Phytophthora sojae]|eukprot:XP_009524127.1 hypothetical protein PHYSODRAFT_329361 [Phytophthora sojae]
MCPYGRDDTGKTFLKSIAHVLRHLPTSTRFLKHPFSNRDMLVAVLDGHVTLVFQLDYVSAGTVDLGVRGLSPLPLHATYFQPRRERRGLKLADSSKSPIRVAPRRSSSVWRITDKGEMLNKESKLDALGLSRRFQRRALARRRQGLTRAVALGESYAALLLHSYEGLLRLITFRHDDDASSLEVARVGPALLYVDALSASHDARKATKRTATTKMQRMEMRPQSGAGTATTHPPGECACVARGLGLTGLGETGALVGPSDDYASHWILAPCLTDHHPRRLSVELGPASRPSIRIAFISRVEVHHSRPPTSISAPSSSGARRAHFFAGLDASGLCEDELRDFCEAATPHSVRNPGAHAGFRPSVAVGDVPRRVY